MVVFVSCLTSMPKHVFMGPDLEILKILPRKFTLEFCTDCCAHHLVSKQAVINGLEMLNFALREDFILTVPKPRNRHLFC